MAHNIANIAKGLFGENKEVSAAMALVDTYVSAQKAYTSQLIAGDPSSPIRAAIAAASAVASGLMNVKKIMSVTDKGGGAGAGAGQSQGPPRPTGAANPIQSVPQQSGAAQPQIGNFSTAQQSTVRVINVARDTAEVVNNEIMVENFAND
jgi:hypothetical protein